MKLKSTLIGKLLQAMLVIFIILNAISIFTAYTVIYYHLLNFQLHQVLTISSAILFYLLVIVYLVWLFKVHQDFKESNTEYPITPGCALARVLIPFYNLYGLWNIYSTMSNHFKDHNSLEKLGIRLAITFPFYYVLYFFTTLLDRIIAKSPAGSVANVVVFGSYILDFILPVIYLLMVFIVMNALHLLATVKPDARERHEESFEITE